MKKLHLFKTILLLCALIVGSLNLWGQASLPFSYTSNGKPSGVTGFSDSGCGNYDSKTGTKFDNTGDNATLYFNAKPGKLTFDIVLNGTLNDNNEFTVSASSNGSSYSVVKTYKGKSEIPTTTKNCSIEEDEFPSGTRYIKWTYVTKGSGNVGMGNINLNLGSPDFSLAAGEYVGDQTVTISTATGYTLKYTTDGSDPKLNGTAVNTNTTNIVVSESMIIKAVAVSGGTKYSAIKSVSYTIMDDSEPHADVSLTTLPFGDVEVGQSKNLTFTVTPANLTGDLTIACDNDKYTLSPTSIPQATETEQTITVTASPAAANDDMDGTITISGGGITAQYVTLSATPYVAATVSLVADPVGKGTFTYNAATVTSIDSKVGATITVTAVPADGYLFDGWTATNATPASSNVATTEFTLTAASVTLTASFVVDPHNYATIEGSDISSSTNTKTGYGEEKVITKDGLIWSHNGWQDDTYYSMIQLRDRTHAKGVSWIKLPTFSGDIKSISFSVTAASATSKEGAAVTTTLNFQSGSTSSEAAIATGSCTSGKKINIDLSELGSNYNTGYITVGASTGLRIWDITVAYIPTDINVSIGTAKYATFCDHLARDFSASGITVYAAAATASSVEFDKVTDGIVPANTGVVLFSETKKDDVAIPVATSAASYDFSSNEMIGVNAKTLVAYDGEGSKKNYILADGTSGVGFYKAKDTGANLAAHKAYLSTATAASARDFLGFEDETTGIEKVETAKQNAGVYFNLAGQRVVNPTKGLYIVNGKKVIK